MPRDAGERTARKGSARIAEASPNGNDRPTKCPYRCKDCRKFFSGPATKSILAESNVPLHKWLMAMYLLEYEP